MPRSAMRLLDEETFESGLLRKYWEETGGLIFTEVIVGKGGIFKNLPNATPRRIDGVRIVPSDDRPLTNEIRRFNNRKRQELQELMNGAVVEVIEVKRRLNRVVLGQVIIGTDLLEMDYSLSQQEIRQVVVVKIGDHVLEEVCKRRGIHVYRTD